MGSASWVIRTRSSSTESGKRERSSWAFRAPMGCTVEDLLHPACAPPATSRVDSCCVVPSVAASQADPPLPAREHASWGMRCCRDFERPGMPAPLQCDQRRVGPDSEGMSAGEPSLQAVSAHPRQRVAARTRVRDGRHWTWMMLGLALTSVYTVDSAMHANGAMVLADVAGSGPMSSPAYANAFETWNTFSSRTSSSPVTFRLRAETKFGWEVCVTGGCEALGYWNPDKALLLRTDPSRYPIWEGVGQLPGGCDIEYKYLMRPRGRSVLDQPPHPCLHAWRRRGHSCDRILTCCCGPQFMCVRAWCAYVV